MNADYIIVGDGSRYTFLRWLIDNPFVSRFQDQDIWVRYAENFTVDKREQDWWISTGLAPPGMTLYFPQNGIPENISNMNSPRWFIFEEQSLHKNITTDLVFKIRTKKPEASVLVVMMCMLNSGWSDYHPPLEGVQEAIQSYTAEKTPVIAVQNPSKMNAILNWSEPLSAPWMRKAKQYLDNFNWAIEDFDDDYEYFLTDHWGNSEDIQNKVCSLDSVKDSRLCIWDHYTNAAHRMLFPNDPTAALNKIGELYKNLLSDSPLVTWDIEEDRALIIKKLKAAFTKKLRDNKSNSLPLKQRDINSYLLATQENGPDKGINQLFWEVVDKFVKQTAKEILKHHLQQHYEQLEEALL